MRPGTGRPGQYDTIPAAQGRPTLVGPCHTPRIQHRMTFRARPIVRRLQRPSWDTRDRRNFYLNLAFGLAGLAALVILGIAVALSYYNDHLASVGSVNGQSITKDELRDRAAIEDWRLEIEKR